MIRCSAEKLAKVADVYVNDAVSARRIAAHASTEGVPAWSPNAVASAPPVC